MKKYILIFFLFLIVNCQLLINNCNAQTHISKKDTLHLKQHDPKTASWLALIPGAGQIYNKKYWKLPIVYGGLGASGFLIYYYADLTGTYRKEYVARINDEPEKQNPAWKDESDDVIYALRNASRRNMEISIAACAIIYALSILDASVDAHLYYFDVSDNLSLGIKPKLDFNPILKTPTPSLALVIKF